MKIPRIKLCLFCFLMLVPLFVSHEAVAAKDTRFACGESVEAEVWALWDTNVRNFLHQQQLHDRLLKQGDVYALYDFQNYTHNMVSMARRCNRTNRLMEVARLVHTAYGALEPGIPSSSGRRWVCHGGAICNDKNKLLNKEVMLDSAQFLAIASSVANALALSNGTLGDEEKAFIRETVQIVTEHLLRWGSDAELSMLRKVTSAKPPRDKKGSSSSFFFTDKHLWMITIYAELAGILQSQESQYSSFAPRSLLQLFDSTLLAVDNKAKLRRHLSALLQFFAVRVSLQRNANSRLGNVNLADLDRGYWQFYPDNLYAGYEDDLKPVVCLPLKNDKHNFTMKFQVSADTVQKRQDTGWDFSHACRLVHALDALERNRNSLRYVFSLSDNQLPNVDLPSAFANTLVAVIWNGDTAKPLFSNYWSGANGWFRVAYDIGIGQCREGYPPYGMTDSFLTGGYITWSRYRPIIGLLGQSLYDLINSPVEASSPFIVKYYPSLSKSAGTQRKNLAKFMFLPSLVGVTK